MHFRRPPGHSVTHNCYPHFNNQFFPERSPNGPVSWKVALPTAAVGLKRLKLLQESFSLGQGFFLSEAWILWPVFSEVGKKPLKAQSAIYYYSNTSLQHYHKPFSSTSHFHIRHDPQNSVKDNSLFPGNNSLSPFKILLVNAPPAVSIISNLHISLCISPPLSVQKNCESIH